MRLKTESIGFNFDTAVFSGVRANYTITVNNIVVTGSDFAFDDDDVDHGH